MTIKLHLLVPDLFLQHEVTGKACAGLALPALEWLLARARAQILPEDSLEAALCEIFDVKNHAIASVTLLADGMLPGDSYWLRADPVHIRMQRDQMILQPDVTLNEDEAAQLCASLNVHFLDEGLHFFSPHPQRWYLQLDSIPDMTTCPLAQAAGKNVRANLPRGSDALRWHSMFNEIQMLFFEHPVNLARESRGDLPINSVWLWGGGNAAGKLAQKYTQVIGDSPLAESFAQAAGIPYATLSDNLIQFGANNDDNVLVVWEGLRCAVQQGDVNAWRDSVQRLEKNCAAPFRDALRAGQIVQLTLDVPSERVARRFELTRSASWKLWRLPKSLARYT